MSQSGSKPDTKSDRPEGWRKLQLQIPDHLLKRFNDVRDELPGQSVKVLGTAAVALFLALRPEIRLALYRWANSHAIEPEKTSPVEAASLLLVMLNAAESTRLIPTESEGGEPPTTNLRLPSLAQDSVPDPDLVESMVKVFAPKGSASKNDPGPIITHYVSRILDPEVTPPPGGKQSDRGGAKKRGAG